MRGTRRILCELTLRAGTIAWDWNGRAGTEYTTLGPDYGLRSGIDVIVTPKQ